MPTPKTVHRVELTLSEPKKHSGKYVVAGTESDRYPQYFYLRRDWFPSPTLPMNVDLVIQVPNAEVK